MLSAADIAREQDEGLKQLFQAGLELSLQVQANAMAAEPVEQARLSLTFHRLSRGVRQTAALRMKLARDAERSGREMAAEVIQLDKRRLAKRKAHVKAAVECLIWTEAESDEAEAALKADLEDLLDIESQDAETFEAEPPGAQIARLAEVIGLKDPPPQGEGDHEVVEGVAAHEPPTPRPSTPSPPSAELPLTALRAGGASDDDPDDYWRSSA
jgi:hypothetical protein